MFLFTFNSCKKDVFSNESSLKKVIVDTDIVNENFNDFLEKFSKDSIFQISRIDFPLRVSQLDDDYQPMDKIIVKENFSIIDFSKENSGNFKETDNYFQKSILKDNQAKLEIRGIDNGIYLDVFFERIKGKWKLKAWTDSST